MKLIHMSDLHIGKRVNGFSMLEDQEYILSQIIHIVDEEKPDAVLIAGDVYDKPVPPAEAIGLFDDFLVHLSGRGVQVFVISGNHDSPERIAFGGRLMDQCGIHLSPVYDGRVTPVALSDRHGTVDVYMLPFLKPAHVRRWYPEDGISSYTDALRAAIRHMDLNPANRNVLMTHQFVTGASRSESEELSVGGSDNVDASVFEGFDYVALGHLHGPQSIGKETVRYSGTPLKYSFSEVRHEKSITIVELREKGDVSLRTAGLVPRRDMREIRGSYLELTAKSHYEGACTDDYLHVTLTDEEEIPHVVGNLRVVYPNLMKLDYDNCRTLSGGALGCADGVEGKPPLQLFSEFYEKQNGRPMCGEQTEFLRGLIEEIWGDEG